VADTNDENGSGAENGSGNNANTASVEAMKAQIAALKDEAASRRVKNRDLAAKLEAAEKASSERAAADRKAEDERLAANAEFEKLAEQRAAELASVRAELDSVSVYKTKYEANIKARLDGLVKGLGDNTVQSLGVATLPLETQVSVLEAFSKAKAETAATQAANTPPTVNAPPVVPGGPVTTPNSPKPGPFRNVAGTHAAVVNPRAAAMAAKLAATAPK